MKPDALTRLTPRQCEVLKLAATGATHKEIANRLGVSPKTARNHLANLYENLDVHTRAQAVICAINLGLIDLPSSVDAKFAARANPVEHIGAGFADANASSTSSESTITIFAIRGRSLAGRRRV